MVCLHAGMGMGMGTGIHAPVTVQAPPPLRVHGTLSDGGSPNLSDVAVLVVLQRTALASRADPLGSWLR